MSLENCELKFNDNTSKNMKNVIKFMNSLKIYRHNIFYKNYKHNIKVSIV